jgi:ABC-2 type transport system ATP-binding protein
MSESNSSIYSSDLTKRFGDFVAVDKVSLEVRAGEILALLGPNGAGKTTTIRMLASILHPSSGRAKVAGYDTVSQSMQVRQSIGLLTEQHGLYNRMRAMEYLRFFGKIYGMLNGDIERRSTDLLRRFGLEPNLQLRLGQYSKGMRQKLTLVRTMLHEPEVLLLDEPTSAMDPASAKLVRESILSLRSKKRAIIVCTHNLSEAQILADRIAIIRKGSIVAEGTAESLRQSFLGFPIMELRFSGAIDGATGYLPEGAVLDKAGEDWVRYRVSDPVTVNPKVLEAMAGAGLQVVTLSDVGRSLEEVYLQVVAQGLDPAEGPNGS